MKFSGITLVTGAAGFMGSHVVEYLAKSGVSVRASARPRKDTSFFDRLGVEYKPADLTRPETIGPLFAGGVDRVIHLGAICNFSTPYERLYPTNVLGVKLITEAAIKAKVRRFVHVTSTSVYGPYRGKPFREDSPRDPQDDYGKSKRDGEDMLKKAIGKGLDAVLCRPCTVYGPRCTDGAGKAFSRPTSIAAIPGDGKRLLSNVRAEDVARAVVFLSERDGISGEAFNLADDSNPTIGGALALAAAAFGKKPPGLHLPLWLVRIAARVDGFFASRRGKIPDLEYDAVRYLYDDYVVDNAKLKKSGFTFLYPDFARSMEEIGRLYREGKLEIR